MPEHIYRYRSIDALLGKHKELEAQSLYFAPFHELNDPMEGFRDIYWSGDDVVWVNLIRHYGLCLMMAMDMTLLAGEWSRDLLRNITLWTHSTLPSDELRRRHNDICNEILSDSEVLRIVGILASQERHVRRAELEFYLGLVHKQTLPVVMNTLIKEGMVRWRNGSAGALKPAKPAVPVDDFAASLTEFWDISPATKQREIVFLSSSHITEQLALIHAYNNRKQAISHLSNAMFFFPAHYVSSLGRLVHPDWGVVCFSGSPTQASMWGNYAQHHRGVCLKFSTKRSDGDQQSVRICRVMGAAGSKHKIEPVLAEVDHALTEVRYVKEYPQVDFFRSIGKLVMPVLMRDWYMDGAGRVSRCADGVSNETEEWRTDYWRRFEASASQKLEDWRHESEYRLIWPRLGGYDHNETERLATYPFETLRGLIFGINTSHSDKMAIMEIIEAKCRLHKREDFEFAQAEYDDREGRIGIYPFGLLKPYVP